MHSLSIGERQRVEIIRCLMQDIRLLILDEPTSVLTPQEAEDLFVTLRRLAAEGCSILFISHKLAEVRALVPQRNRVARRAGRGALRAGRLLGSATGVPDGWRSGGVDRRLPEGGRQRCF